MRVLVTGATGLIGGAVARRLASAGHEDRGACPLGRERGPSSPAQGYTAVHGDLADAAGIAEAARGVEAVVHAASTDRWGTGQPTTKRRRVRSSMGLSGTAKRFVCIRAVACSMERPATPPRPRTARFIPIDLVRFRQALEGEVLAAAAAGVHSIVIRPAWVYGNRGGTAMMMVGSAKEHGAARYVGRRAEPLDDSSCRRSGGPLPACAGKSALLPRSSTAPMALPSRSSTSRVRRARAPARRAGWRNGRWTTHGRRSGAFADAIACDQVISGELAKVRARVEPIAAFHRRRVALPTPERPPEADPRPVAPLVPGSASGVRGTCRREASLRPTRRRTPAGSWSTPFPA